MKTNKPHLNPLQRRGASFPKGASVKSSPKERTFLRTSHSQCGGNSLPFGKGWGWAICLMFFTLLLWRGAGAEAIAQTISATGGKITYLDTSGTLIGAPVSGGYTVHTFNSSGKFTVTNGSGNIEYLVVAGGGGGANAAGGGAGGVLRNNALNYLVTAGSYPVTVGDGGAVGANGKNSVFKTFTAIGGGTARTSGGSGGGGTPTAEAPGKGTSGQGYAGGSGNSYYRLKTSGGGGGAGAVGVIHGGIGVQSSITGIATYYGGGGGGYRAAYQPQHRAALPGVGGAGGGGNYGQSGTPNTGGGGGGNGGTGGSGIVIVRYRSTVCLPSSTVSPDSTICKGSTITLNATGGKYYKWMKGTDTTSIGKTSSLTVSPATTTIYTVRISNDSCSINKTVKVSVISLSGATVSGKTVVCPGDSTLLTASGGSKYLWNTGDTIKTIKIKPTKDTLYTVKISNNCTDTTITVPITMFSPTVIKITGDTIICKGTNTKLTTRGGTAYKWSTGATTASITVSPVRDTSYKVVVTNGKCIDSATIAVKVKPYPVVNAGTDKSVCQGNNYIQLNGSASGGSAALSYSWSPAGLLSDSTITNPLAILEDTITSFILKVTDGICAKADTVVIKTSNINAIISGDTAICSGDTAILSINGGAGATYKWSTGDTLAGTKLKPLQDSMFFVTVTNGGSCVASMIVSVGTYPVVNAGTDTAVCDYVGIAVPLFASGGTATSIYHWQGAGLSDTTISNPIAKPSGTTSYIATITDDICSSRDTVIVKINALPKVEVTPKIKELNSGENTTLTVTGAKTYLWTPNLGLSNNTIANPVAQPTATITYSVTGIDNNGCISTDSVTITLLKQLCETYVPNAFSPNGDGQNDLLKAHGDCIKELSFSIYDRWGEKVFETTELNAGWDGTYKGKQMNTGVFVYYLSATLSDGTPVAQKGNISLIR